MKQLDLKSIILFITLSLSFTAKSQTTLSAGDIVFTGYNADDNTVNGPSLNDDFSFMLLKNITSGTTIYFTDFGWCTNTNAFQTANPCGPTTGAVSDGVVQWTATANMSYGSQVTIRCRYTPSANYGTASGYQGTYNFATEYVSLVTGGDQLIAFQGTLSSPTLLAAMGMNGAWDATVSNCTFTSSAGIIPPALSSNDYAFNIVPEIDNARVKNTIALTGNAATDRAAIHNPANWDVNDVTAFALPAPIITLPVNFLRFSALRNNETIQLVWDVADEINLMEYRVQKTINGRTWEQLAALPANGSTSYTWTDANPGTGKIFYRICSADNDGHLKYTRIVSLDAGVSAFRISAAPNPFREYTDININLAEATGITMQLTGSNGQVVWENHSSLPAGSHVIRISGVNKFAAGVYQLVIKSTKNTNYQTISIMKQ